MTQQVIQLPYTAQEIQTLLARVNNIDAELDGPWVNSYTNIVPNATALGSGESKEISLANYLPADNHCYEVCINAWVSTNNAQTALFLRTSVENHGHWTAIAYKEDPNIRIACQKIIIGTDRKIWVENNAERNAGLCNVEAIGYKRLGNHNS